jgi:hypothetical protein
MTQGLKKLTDLWLFRIKRGKMLANLTVEEEVN